MMRIIAIGVAVALLASASAQKTVDVQFKTDAARDLWWSQGWPTAGPANAEVINGTDVIVEIPAWVMSAQGAYAAITDRNTGNVYVAPSNSMKGFLVLMPEVFNCVSQVDLVVTNGGKPIGRGKFEFEGAGGRSGYSDHTDASDRVSLHCVPGGSIRVRFVGDDGSKGSAVFNVALNRKDPIPVIDVDLAESTPIWAIVGGALLVVVAIGSFVVARRRSSRSRRRR